MVRQKRLAKNVILGVILTSALIILLFPYIWNISMSLKPGREMATGTLFPKHPTFEHYRAFFQRGNLVRPLLNSFMVSACTGLLATGFSFLAAYAIVRFSFVGKAAVFQTIIGAQFIPLSSVVIPFYLLLYRLKLLDTVVGLTIVYLVYCVPFATWLLIGFLQKIPKDFEEAAQVDGCSRLGALFKVVLPIARPGIFVTFVFVFIKAWQEYLAAVMLTATDRARTLPVVLGGLQTQTSFEFGTMMAGVVIAGLPVLLAFMFLNKWFLKGMVGGGVKG